MKTRKTYTGQCQCGNIKYSLEGKPDAPHLCHCHMCQRMAGAPVVAWVSFPLDEYSRCGAKIGKEDPIKENFAL